jgi:hypothetical protein
LIFPESKTLAFVEERRDKAVKEARIRQLDAAA